MSGPRLGGDIGRIQSGLRMLLMSAYADAEVLGAAAGGSAPLLQKPFTRQTLLEHVRSVLDRG
jgi:FixJ family two-component response regulator